MKDSATRGYIPAQRWHKGTSRMIYTRAKNLVKVGSRSEDNGIIQIFRKGEATHSLNDIRKRIE
ncbi:hypothetical protein UFOVP386_36 [uncultured Caudovirales phage]|uniref:Uncharacterized protein n=1 Tax=uncultured Caudovirales phage TaxID=2100421 RepID=A0A6J7X1D6_9CAUD|nr:hypothetical protein UFOVP386_36 [uncultured Caudovirales phage]